jgi:uncharacterized surface protein with fasciclin (FAS1) repeats
MLNRSTTLQAVALATVLTTGLGSAASAQTRNCVDVLAGTPEFSRFANGLVHSYLADTVRNANDITIFAPTNEAVSRMNPTLLDRLFPREDGARQADPVLAPAAFGAHVVQGRRNAAGLAQGGQFDSVSGTPLNVSSSGGTVMVKGAGGTEARVTRVDIACSNGVIHAIDSVLLR